MSHLLAPALRPGQTIGFFSPSSPATHFAPRRTARAIAFLEDRGYRVRAGALTGRADGYRSGSIAARAEELNALLRDPEVRCVISTIGGSNSNALLPHLDYEAVRRDPKLFVGYSDVTALHAALYTQTGLISFYGPALVASFGEFEPLVGHTWRAFQQLVSGEHRAPLTLANPTHWTDERLDWESQTEAKSLTPNALLTLTGGRATGRLIGGNLNTYNGLWGTPYCPQIAPGDILFIEDAMKDAADMERLFARLHNSGVLEHLAGLVIGKHEQFDDCDTGRAPYEILLEVLGGTPPPYPTLVDYDCAHTHPMLTLPLGLRVTLDADAQQITLNEPWLAA